MLMFATPNLYPFPPSCIDILRGVNDSILLMGSVSRCEVHQLSRHQKGLHRLKNSRLAPLTGLPRNSWVSRSRLLCNIDPDCAKKCVPCSNLYLPPFLVFFAPPKRMAFWGLGAALRFWIFDFLRARSAFCFVTLRSWVVVFVRGAPSASSSCITSASADRVPTRA